MLYKNINGKLSLVKQKEFDKEKVLQSLVENNLDTLFNLKFLATEYSLGKFRFDSVAYNSEDSSFVIIEYKNRSNDSLVDQGFAYLNTVLNDKSSLVLLFNKVMNVSKQVEDFDWSQTRIYFVSPKFTEYQKSATGFLKMPFKLFEVNQYDGLFNLNEIESGKVKDDTGLIETNIKQEDSVINQITVYTEEKHYNWVNSSIKEVYLEFKERISESLNVTIEPKKFYIAFKNQDGKNVFDFEPYKKEWRVYFNVSFGSIDDPYGKIVKAPENHRANGDCYFSLTSSDDIDYLISLLKQAYKKVGNK